MAPKLDCPVLELRHTASAQAQVYPPYPVQPTSISVLEITRPDVGSLSDGGVKYVEGLDHDGLVNHLQTSEKKPLLRILFVNSARSPRMRGNLKSDPVHSAIGPSTVQYLIEELCISPAFMAVLTYKTWVLKTGNCHRVKHVRSEGGKGQSTIEGWYRYSCELQGLPSHAWFSYSAESTTYLVNNCEHNGVQKAILRCVDEGFGGSLLRPLAIDGFIAEAASEGWGKEVLGPRTILIEYESRDRATMMKETSESLRDLHVVSYNLLIIKEDMTDHIERLKYLLNVRKSLLRTFGNRTEYGVDISHTLSFLLSETHIRRRWVQSFADRIGIQINLFYNLSAQRDSKINLEIAGFTSKIATETQRDSSSMITMAAVTMLFLPGTFVSAIFSMVFFDTSPAGGSVVGLTLVRGWWLFPAITIPLTILIFAIWNIWRVRRNGVQMNLSSDALTRVPAQLLTPGPDKVDLSPQMPPHRMAPVHDAHLEKGGHGTAWVNVGPPDTSTEMLPLAGDVHTGSLGYVVGLDAGGTLPKGETWGPNAAYRAREVLSSTPARRRLRSRSRSPSLYTPYPHTTSSSNEDRRPFELVQPAFLVSDIGTM